MITTTRQDLLATYPGTPTPIEEMWQATAPLPFIDWTKPSLIIYVSSPYSLGDQIANVRFACEVGDNILAKGHIPFIPHLSHLWHFVSPKSYDEWLRIDKAFIPRCDALLRVGGESKGADMEVEFAKDNHILVYYSLEEIHGE